MNQKTTYEALEHFNYSFGLKDFAGKLAKLFPLIKQLKALPGYCATIS